MEGRQTSQAVIRVETSITWGLADLARVEGGVGEESRGTFSQADREVRARVQIGQIRARSTEIEGRLARQALVRAIRADFLNRDRAIQESVIRALLVTEIRVQECEYANCRVLVASQADTRLTIWASCALLIAVRLECKSPWGRRLHQVHFSGVIG